MFEGILGSIKRPPDSAGRSEKKRYGEQISNALASVIAEDLRNHGMAGCLPDGRGGMERRFAGGIGAKKVDVSWSTEDSGLMFAASLKTINYRDAKSDSYQKNLTNRRGDMLYEAVTLHKRFPYSTLTGFVFLHHGAEADHEGKKRQSTFLNAHHRFRIFTGRETPGDPPEQFEHAYIALYHDEEEWIKFFEVGRPLEEVPWEELRLQILDTVASRNPDHYVVQDGDLTRS